MLSFAYLANWSSWTFATINLSGDCLSGASVGSLVADATSHLPQRASRTRILQQVLHLLFDTHVISSEHVAFTHQSICGTDMGLAHSSSVANNAFVNKCEIKHLTKEAHLNASIFGFWRYGDDALLLFATCESL